MSVSNLHKIVRLAELKIKIDSLPGNSPSAISLTREFISLYREFQINVPHLHKNELNELIIFEIQKIKTAE